MSAATAPPRSRSDGQATRARILAAAAALATTEGLDRLSIGGLADHLEISKSGVYAHFRSKEALQLETIATAWRTFDVEVVEPGLQATPGRATVIALVDAFLDHLARRVFPGGCFFASTIAEMRMRPGNVTARLAAFDAYWTGLLREHLAIARDAGEIGADEDPTQVAFEIESHVLHAHFSYPQTGDLAVLDRVRRAVRRRLGVAGLASEP